MDPTHICQLMEHIPVGIIALENERLTLINQTGINILGAQSDEEILGQLLLDFIQRDYHQQTKQQLEKWKHKQVVELRDIQMIRLDGELVDVHIKFVKTTYQGQEMNYLLVEDVTKLKQGQRLLQESDKLLVLGELAAGIAHEIRNPLTSLKGFLQLIAASPHVNHTYSEIMLVEIERINMIVNELLIFVKPQEINTEQVQLIYLLDTVVNLLSPQAILANVQIMTHYTKGVNQLVVSGEANKIKQVFINLIKNAIEAMPQGGKIIVLVDCKDDHVQVNVIDQGCGIPQNKLPKIGETFYTTKPNGMGLGLMVTKNIIDQHQGSISFISEEGKGTIVEVNFPVNSCQKNEQDELEN